jgi:hypothetical protein
VAELVDKLLQLRRDEARGRIGAVVGSSTKRS